MNEERIEMLTRDTTGTVEPYVYDNLDDVTRLSSYPFPLITDRLLSDEWEVTGQTWFVDSSGFGSESGAADTTEAFQEKLADYVDEFPEHGFGVSGVGQFQVYVTAYRRK